MKAGTPGNHFRYLPSRVDPPRQASSHKRHDLRDQKAGSTHQQQAWADDHLFHLLSPQDHGRDVRGFSSVKSVEAPRARGTPRSPPGSLGAPGFSFSASPIREWKFCARFASRRIIHQLCDQARPERVFFTMRIAFTAAVPPHPSPQGLILHCCHFPHPYSRNWNMVTQTTPPRGPPPASSRRAAEARRTPCRAPWRR